MLNGPNSVLPILQIVMHNTRNSCECAATQRVLRWNVKTITSSDSYSSIRTQKKSVKRAAREFSLILKVSYAFNFGGGALCSHTGYKLESTLLNRIVPVKRFQRTGSPDCGSQVRKRKNVVQCNVRMKTFLLLFE